MVRVGGFLKSQNRIRRQRARGRFISPYQVGGTIFGKSTMARYPLMHTSSRLDPMILKHLKQRRKMKGGTIFSDRRRNNPWGFPTATDRINPAPWRVKQALRRMKGGTICGTSTRMRMSHNPMKVLTAAQEKAMMDRWFKKRMKGGTIFGPGDLRKVLWANQAKARKQRGGNVFSRLKKRIQIDFPHRPYPAAHPMHDWYRVRKGIKRGRR